MPARSRLDKDGVTLPAWALSFVVLLLGWGVTQELRLGRVEDHLAAVAARIDTMGGDHDRLVAIEAQLEALLASQGQLVDLLRARATSTPTASTPTPTPAPTPTPTPAPTPTGTFPLEDRGVRGSLDLDGPPDP